MESLNSFRHFTTSKIKAAFSPLKRKWLFPQDLLTADFRHKKSIPSLAIVIIALIFTITTSILILPPAFCGQDLVTGFEDKDLPILNEELRKLKNLIDTLNTSVSGLSLYKVKSSSDDPTADYLDGKVAKSIVITSEKLELSGDAASPGNNQVYGTNGSGTKGWKADPSSSDTNTSNVIFEWHGNDQYTNGKMSYITGDTDFQTSVTGAQNYSYYLTITSAQTYYPIIVSKFLKVAGVSTVTIQASIWSGNVDADKETLLKVDIGGQNNTVKSITSTTPTWYAGTGTINVSSLTNGTVYTITISLTNEGDGMESYCNGVVLFGS